MRKQERSSGQRSRRGGDHRAASESSRPPARRRASEARAPRPARASRPASPAATGGSYQSCSRYNPDSPYLAANRGHAHSAARRPRRARRRIIIGLSLVLVALLAGVAYATVYVVNANNGLKRSNAIEDTDSTIFDGQATQTEDIDLLIMGLDSRVDINGKALPEETYEALHAGDESTGGLNSNVLIYVHIPKDGSSITAMSIPRDDYVDLSGSPDGVKKSKIKEAYGLAFDQKKTELAKQGKTGDDAYQEARDAGRKAEIATVDTFLGVRINHFVEVTMGAFYDIAKVMEPITVTVNNDTQDEKYAGINLTAGTHELTADEAVAFVRQRRDNVNQGLNFTDLDRTRRQQAFIIAVLNKLKSMGIGDVVNGKVDSLIKIAQKSMVVDSKLDLMSLYSKMSGVSGSDIRFYTLPIEGFGETPGGASVNTVDVEKTQSTVQAILTGDDSSTPYGTAKDASEQPSPTELSVLTAEGLVSVK